MSGLLARFRRDQSGSTAVEYALVASGIFVAVVTAVMALGTYVSGLFGNVASEFARIQ
jgi:pilus assembly protein Flp/PilA